MHSTISTTAEPQPADPAPDVDSSARVPLRRRRHWPWFVATALLGAVGYAVFTASSPGSRAAAPGAAPVMRGVPVVVAAARQGDVPVLLTGLGSVTGFNTVTVKSRVDGQVMRIAFQEGQFVHEGDLLVEIDPRPFQVQLTQAEGQMARDVAQLTDARLNLDRYRSLLDQGLVAKQEFDNQIALVHQYEGTVKLDQGLIDAAKLQLTYSRITAPISGRVGLRLVDSGNMVRATDQNGLLVIAQVQPIAVLFALPADNLPPVLDKLRAGEPLQVEAYDRAGQTKIASGSLLTVDNQIDQSTGTARLKAVFQNENHVLFPNQFVNVRLLLDVRTGTVIVPVAAIQRGPQGTFVYAVKGDQTVEVRPVTVGPIAGGEAAIDSGLSAGEQVVVDGVDKLRPGSAVQVRQPETDAGGRRPRT
jgi:membrane fusion protein, multidrug efflux system